MKLHGYFIIPTLIAACWLMAGAANPARAQLTFVVNSLADDDSTHAWDDPDTPEIDESMDGKCEDARHKCSARAAIDEAWNMNNGNGVPLDLTINVPGTLFVNSPAPLSPPDGSNLHGNLQTTIGGGFIAVEIGNGTTVHGLKFDGTLVGISIKGDGNTISGNTVR